MARTSSGPERAPRLLSPAAAVLVFVCLTSVCRAAVIPPLAAEAPAKVDAAVAGAGAAAPALETPPSPFRGAPPSPAAPALDGPVGAGARGLAAPGAEPALVAGHPLAHAARLDARPPLDAADALVPDGQPVAAGAGDGLVAGGGAVGVAPAPAEADEQRGAPDDAAQTTSALDVTPAADAHAKGSLLQAVLAALQGLRPPPPPQQQQQQQQQQPPPPPSPQSIAAVQVRPHKPKLSNAFLAPLVQVLSYLVDAAAEREAPLEAPQTTPSADDSETKPPAVEAAPPSPGSEQIVIDGPLQGVVDLLSHVTSALGGIGLSPVSITIEDLHKSPVPNDDDEDGEDDMMQDMPVVQSDVPVVSEETVPMMMMIDMVPSDAPEMVMDQEQQEEDEQADEQSDEDVATPPPAREFSHYVQQPSADWQDGDDADDAVLDDQDVDALDSKKQGVVFGAGGPEPSPALLLLIKLKMALSAEAKRQGFKNQQGFSDAMEAELAQTSALSGREQLGALLATVLERREIKSPKTQQRAVAALRELEDDHSDVSLLLDGIPALQYRL